MVEPTHVGQGYNSAMKCFPSLHRPHLGRVRMYPNGGQAYADLGKAWTRKGDAPEAIAAYERTLLCDPTQNNIHYRLFELYRKTGHTVQPQSHLTIFKATEAREHAKFQEGLAAKATPVAKWMTSRGSGAIMVFLEIASYAVRFLKKHLQKPWLCVFLTPGRQLGAVRRPN